MFIRDLGAVSLWWRVGNRSGASVFTACVFAYGVGLRARVARYGWLALFVVMLIGARPSWAIEEIAVIGTRVERALEELPNNISVLGAEQLAVLSPVHIQQALSQVPGVNYHRGSGQESLPAIRSAVLTGAGACGSVLILEQAIAVRGAGSCNVNELFDTHFEQAQRIEVVRGANTAFYGSNSLTGSINVSLPARGANLLALELGENAYARVKTALSYQLSERNYGRVYVTLSHDGGFRDDAGYSQSKVSWRHHLELDKWSVDAGFTATDLDQQTAGFVVGLNSYLDPNLRTQNLDPEAFRDTQSWRGWASFTRQISARRSLRITPYVRITDMDFRLHFLPGDPLEQNRQTGIGWQSALTTEHSEQLSWSVGLDAEFSDSELVQTQDEPTQGSAFLQATIPTGTHYDYQVDSVQVGGFAHLHWQLSEALRLIAGARLETVRYDYDNRSLTGRTRDDGTLCGFGGCRYNRPGDREDNFTDLSPRLELQYAPTAALSWYLSLADSFRAPQATELYRLQREQNVADLDSVRARTFETGLKWQGERSQLEVALYHSRQRNVIIRDTDFFNVDGQRTRSTGLEVSAQHRFNRQWSVRLIANFADHQYANDLFINGDNINGNQVDTAPRFFGSAFLAWQASERFSSELELQNVGSYFLDLQNLSTYPGHTVVNLRSRYQFNEALSLSLRVLNLSNRLYAERADFTSFTDERYFPGELRSVLGELRWVF